MSYVTYSRSWGRHMRSWPRKLLGIDTIKHELDKLYPQNNLSNLEYTILQTIVELNRYSSIDITTKIGRRQGNAYKNLERVLKEAKDLYKIKNVTVTADLDFYSI